MPLPARGSSGMPEHARAVAIEFRANEYRWVQVYDVLKARILDGTYAPHSPLPSETQLEQELGVAKKTARKAVHRLRDEGLVYTKPNLGNFVADHPHGDESDASKK
ncbi:winged helix-turn-helix domain-containing protein [Nonomuraea sp. NPDC049709]|uniref:winged helix-turn-helix domain-containing protein n=1 Tax=Nonomuraea sp. NPDC049709 TaxID=3154736 RepID=UPI0034351009